MDNREAAAKLLAHKISLSSSDEELFEAIDLAIDALQMRTAETPFFCGDGYWNGELVYDAWECPNCGKEYEVEFDAYKYCPECGKAVEGGNQNE